MMQKIFYIISAIIVLICIFSISYLEAKPYLAEVKIAPVKVYKSMLENYQQKQYEKVNTSLGYVKPIIDTIKLEFEIDLNTEFQTTLKQKDNTFYTTLNRLIFYDIQVIFNSIQEEGKTQSPVILKNWFRMAYANYLLLSSTLKENKETFIADRELKRLFSTTYGYLGTESPYGEMIPPNLKLFKENANKISEGISKIYPEIR